MQEPSCGTVRQRSARRLGLIAVLVALIAPLSGLVATAIARTVVGKTAKHGFVRAGISVHGQLELLIVEVSAHCSNHTDVKFAPGWEQPFGHPQGRSGFVSDAYAVVLKKRNSQGPFRLHARFAARLRDDRLTGTAQATETTIPTHVVCKSRPVKFSVALR